jgi:hypothetical protein
LDFIAMNLLPVDRGPHVGRGRRFTLASRERKNRQQGRRRGDGALPRGETSEGCNADTAIQAAFFTRPERMQAVQTRICLRAPFTKARTRRKLGFHRRRRVLFAWLITFPNCGPLPQSSHFWAINALQSKILLSDAYFSRLGRHKANSQPGMNSLANWTIYDAGSK